MAEAKRDENNIPSILGVSSVDGSTPIPLKINPVTGRVLVDLAGSSGDVTGPGSSTDNAIARFDGTTGKIIQDSNVTIDDNGTVNIPSGETYNIDGTPIGTPGGSDTQVQFNDGGSFGGDSEFIFNKTDQALGVGGSPSDFTIDGINVTPIVETKAENNNLGHNTLRRHSNTVELCARTFNLRARGTLASPLAVQNGDTLNCYIVGAHDGTEYRNSARIRTEASGAVSTGIVPTTMKLQTSNTSGTLQSGMEIDENQDVSVPNGDITANNLSGTNTGDQTDMSGISDTKANFNTACSDGDFLFVGDVTGGGESTQSSITAGENITAGDAIVYLDDVYNLSNASYASKTIDITSEETAPLGMTLSSDGLHMYACGNTNDTVYQYDLSTAWDMSTASYASKSLSVTSEDTTPHGVRFGDSGTKMYILGNSTDTVYQYTLSTAWDISTGSYASKSFSVNSQEATPRELDFSEDGTKMYIGGAGNTVYQYTLATAWDMATTSYASKSLSVQSTFLSMAITDGGTKLYTTNSADTVTEYNLSTAYDISTGSASGNTFSVTSQVSDAYGLYVGDGGTKMYVLDENTDGVFQYTIGTGTGYKKSDASDSTLINFAGFASETVTATNPLNLDTAGVNSNQSGLTVGAEYYLADGGNETALELTGAVTSNIQFGLTAPKGQTFTPTSDINFTQIDVNLSYNTGTGADIFCDIYATSAGEPTGASLGTATIGSIANVSYEVKEFIFSSAINLSNGVQYAFILSSPSASATNTFELSATNTNPYPDGAYVFSADSGTTWTINTAIDCYFKIYNTLPSGIISSTAGTNSVKVGKAISATELEIYTGGEVPAAAGGNSYFFSARSGSETNLTSGAITVVNFNTENFDDDNVFASNTFTAPEDGKYVFYARIYLQGSAFTSGYLAPSFYKNASLLQLKYYNGVTSPSTRMSMDISFMGELLTNDTIDLRVNNQTGGSRTLRTDNGASIFYGYKLN